MDGIKTYKEMNSKIVSLLRLSDEPVQIYAAKRIEELQAECEELRQEAAHHEQTAKDYWKEACDYKAKVPEWISVSDMLPLVDEEVIVFGYDSMVRIWTFRKRYPDSADVCWEDEIGLRPYL